MAQYLALLRGINVGGNNKLPMKDLAPLFTAAGCSAVRTYIQSGNVLFEADAATSRRVPQLISDAIEERFGFRIAVLVRSLAQLRQTVGDNPFLPAGADPAKLHVAFLAPDANVHALAQIVPERFLPDEFALQGSDLHVHLINGVGTSKLALALDAKLRPGCTMRNWRTVTTLLRMMESA